MFFSAMRLKALMLVIAAVFAVGFVAGCGDDDDSVSDATEAASEAADAADDAADPAADAISTTTVDIPVADEGLLYAVTEVAAPAGEITLTSVNDQSVPHNIAIETPEGDVLGEVVTDGGVSTVTATLEPGTYEYYCSVPGHREAGMVGTLTVE